MLAYPRLVIPGKLNVKAGLVMLLAAIALGLWLSQVQPLLPASDLPTPAYSADGVTALTESVPGAGRSFITWQEVPKQKYAWHICYAFLGNMGLVNMGGGLALVVLGSRLAAGQIFSQILLLGGMLHPASWALVALTGWENWHWLGNIGALAVAGVVLLLFGHLAWATYRSLRAIQKLAQPRPSIKS
ncbi:MAG: hypothetical protein Q6L68_01515 [Thermostichus sp. DG02_5_bins_236]